MAEGVHLKISQLLKTETNQEVALSCIRALGQLCLDCDSRVGLGKAGRGANHPVAGLSEVEMMVGLTLL